MKTLRSLLRRTAQFRWHMFCIIALSGSFISTHATAESCPQGDKYISNAECTCPAGFAKAATWFAGLSLYHCVGPNTASCEQEAEVAKNMRWFHDDAAKSSRSAWVQGRILRASSVSQVGNADAIRAAYKDGQEHNSQAASLIDQCDDLTVGNIAYRFAESVVRLRACGGAPPAPSATCTDLVENIRWSLLDNHDCSIYARQFMADAMRTDEYKKVRAEWARRAVQVSQGHRLDIAKSVDFISDDLLLQIAEKVYRDYQVAKLDRRPADPDNPFTRQACSGVLLANNFD